MEHLPESAAAVIHPGRAENEGGLDALARASSAGLDSAGALCSAACALHCASVALVPSLLVGLGLGVLVGPTFEWVFTALAILFAATAAVRGWRRHQVAMVALTFAVGSAGLVAGRVLEELELHGVGVIVAVCAAAALVAGHVSNLRLAQRHVSKHG